VCLCRHTESVCDTRRIPTLLHGPGCNLGNGGGCPLGVHYWADLQSVHGFRSYDNTAPNAKRQRVLVFALYLVAYIGECSCICPSQVAVLSKRLNISSSKQLLETRFLMSNSLVKFQRNKGVICTRGRKKNANFKAVVPC